MDLWAQAEIYLFCRIFRAKTINLQGDFFVPFGRGTEIAALVFGIVVCFGGRIWRFVQRCVFRFFMVPCLSCACCLCNWWVLLGWVEDVDSCQMKILTSNNPPCGKIVCALNLVTHQTHMPTLSHRIRLRLIRSRHTSPMTKLIETVTLCSTSQTH